MEIIEVNDKSELNRFLSLPKKIYGKYPKYVQPLNQHLKMMIGKLGRPEKYLFIARKNGKDVARLAAKTHEYKGEKVLHFGFFECVEGEKEAAKKLIEYAHRKHPDLPMKGPYHFRMEDPYPGILLDGFDKDPYFLMAYNPDYYNEYLTDSGLEQAMDLYTYEVEPKDIASSESIKKKAEEAASVHGIKIRQMDPKRLNDEARTIARIFNDALSNNWGFEEFLDEQVKEMVTLLRLFIDHRVVLFAQKDGKDVGCIMMIPNYNPLIKGSKGSITPGLIWRFLTKKKTISTIRGYALGVLKDYHGMGIGSALTYAMLDYSPPAGYIYCEISWVLESNSPMRELSNSMGGRYNKKYRVYERKPIEMQQ